MPTSLCHLLFPTVRPQVDGKRDLHKKLNHALTRSVHLPSDKHVRIELSHDRHECSILRRGVSTLAVARVPTTVGNSSTHLATFKSQPFVYDLLPFFDKPCNAHTMHTPCNDSLCCNLPDLAHPEKGALLGFTLATSAPILHR